MAIIDMKKLLLIGLEGEKNKILEDLQYMGNVEIVDIDQDDELEHYQNLGDTDYIDQIYSDLAEIQFAIEFLTRMGKIEKSLFEVPNEVAPHELNMDHEYRSRYMELVRECREIDRSLTQIDTRTTRIEDTIAKYQSWVGLDIPLERIEDTKTCKVIIGSVEINNMYAFEEAVSEELELMHVEKVGSSRDEANYLVVYHRSIDSEAEAILREFGFSNTTFEDHKGTPKNIIRSLDKELESAKTEETDMFARVGELIHSIEEMELLYDSLMIELDRVKAASRIGESDKTFILKGWVPAREADKLKDRLTKLTEYCYIEFEDPKEGEAFPVALDNPPLVQPFEVITKLYSTPSSSELDPNIYMAPFYFMFFGMMVGDAAYGVIMAIACAYLTKKLKWQGDTKKLGLLIALGGISTSIWGVLFGSWFGNAGELLGISPVLLSPLDQPIEMLILCFALGIVHLFAGMAVKGYMNIREGNVWAAVFDQGFWYVLLIGLILMLVGKEGQAGDVGRYMSIAGAIGLILTQGRHKKGIFRKFFTGVLSLYDVTGYLSDVLSYSRLFALGLTTGIIGTVVNEIGLMFGKSIIGWIFAAIVLVIGHVFNILINSIGAYVHASRLQYIEFFGKFFQGGGHAFNPLSIKTKYTQVYDEEVI